MKNKMSLPDPQELDELLEELKKHGSGLEQPALDLEYVNPWNLGKKKIRGKTSVGAKLPTKLPDL